MSTTATHGTGHRAAIHLIALDIDGTIARPGTTAVTPAVQQAIHATRQAGHHVVLSSGRSLLGVLAVARQLRLTSAWVVASNGAVIARLGPRLDGEYYLHQVITFDPSAVLRLARTASPKLRVATEVVGKGYLANLPFAQGELSSGQQITTIAQMMKHPTTRLVLHAPGAADLAERLRDLRVTVTADGPDRVDVTPPRLSKATALEQVRSLLCVHSNHTIAIGDGLNDVEALRWAARGIAIGGSPPQVQAAADEVTETLANDGAATTLRSLLSRFATGRPRRPCFVRTCMQSGLRNAVIQTLAHQARYKRGTFDSHTIRHRTSHGNARCNTPSTRTHPVELRTDNPDAHSTRNAASHFAGTGSSGSDHG